MNYQFYKNLACLLFVLLLVYSKVYSQKNTIKSFDPGNVWNDTNGEHINAHGGGVLFYNDKYYWFGEHKTEGRSGNSAQVGVRCYSSVDLCNWVNEGVALAVVNDENSEIIKGCVIERPKVLYNSVTKQFVMWFHLEYKSNGYKAARAAVAVSDNVIGPFRYVKSFRPNDNVWPLNYSGLKVADNREADFTWWTPEFYKAVDEGLFVKRDFEKGQMSRDMTLFVDDNGKAYQIRASEENLTIHISRLTDDYLSFTNEWIRAFSGGHNEAPAVFKYNQKYYMITSGCTGWEPNEARLAVADSMMGQWRYIGNPCIGENADKTFFSQSTYVLPLNDPKDSFIFMADRWTPNNPIDGRYVWLPIVFKNDIPQITWFPEWDLSLFESVKANKLNYSSTIESQKVK
jgi:hypothetical protein